MEDKDTASNKNHFSRKSYRKEVWEEGLDDWYARKDSPVLARASRPRCARPLTLFRSPPARSAARGCRSFASNPLLTLERVFRKEEAIERGIWCVVRPEGFEPSTSCSEGRYSIQLSYGRPFMRGAFSEMPPNLSRSRAEKLDELREEERRHSRILKSRMSTRRVDRQLEVIDRLGKTPGSDRQPSRQTKNPQ